MSDSIEQKLKENEALQASIQKSAIFFEELFYNRMETLKKAHQLDEEVLSSLEGTEHFFDYLPLKIDMKQEVAKAQAAQNKAFDTIISELKRLEEEHESLERQLKEEQSRKENQPNGQNGD